MDAFLFYILPGLIIAAALTTVFLLFFRDGGSIDGEDFAFATLWGFFGGLIWPVTLAIIIFAIPSLLLYVKISGDKRFIKQFTIQNK